MKVTKTECSAERMHANACMHACMQTHVPPYLLGRCASGPISCCRAVLSARTVRTRSCVGGASVNHAVRDSGRWLNT
jgi:hypothetical protein